VRYREGEAAPEDSSSLGQVARELEVLTHSFNRKTRFEAAWMARACWRSCRFVRVPCFAKIDQDFFHRRVLELDESPSPSALCESVQA